MEGYTTESEQLEALRRWWEKNSKWIVSGLVIAALVVGGWRVWGYWQAKRANAAAAVYATLVQATQGSKTAPIVKAAQRVVHAYPDTAYGALAGLALAKAEFSQGHQQKAVNALRGVIANSPDKGLAAIARLRLARMQIQLGDAKEALRTLGSSTHGAYAAAVDSIRGDALLKLGQAQRARQAYQRALAESDAASGLHQMLKLRLASMPETAGAKPAATTEQAVPTKPAAAGTGAKA